MNRPPADPHANGPVLAAGRPLEDAPAAVILVHGRGGSAADILGLASYLGHPDLAYLAPQAAGSTWYPYPFMSPREANEPYLGSALAALGTLIGRVEAAGIPAARTVLIGFSQGACLALEFVARHPQRYGGVAGLSGGLIGPAPFEHSIPRQDQGNLAGTPVFLGCSDVDPHIPLGRVHETAAALEGLGALVTTRIYPGQGHMINQDELVRVSALLDALIPAPTG